MVDDEQANSDLPDHVDRAVPSRALTRGGFAVRETHEGPLPHPDTLDRYAGTIPDGANRIMTMAEKEQDQRHRMERWGMICALIVALAFLAAGTGVVLEGHDAAGAVFVGATLVALVTAFIYGRSHANG